MRFSVPATATSASATIRRLSNDGAGRQETRRSFGAALSMDPAVRALVSSVCVAANCEEVPLQSVWEFPTVLPRLSILFIDLAMSTDDPRVLAGEDLVRALRFLNPHVEVFTFSVGREPSLSIRMANLDVAWNFKELPDADSLSLYILDRLAHMSMQVRSRRIHLRISAEQRIVQLEDLVVRLTPVEIRFLLELIHAKERVVRREEVIARLWPTNPPTSDRAIDLLAYKIRQKFARQLGFTNAVVSVRGVGYRLSLPQHVEPIVLEQAAS